MTLETETLLDVRAVSKFYQSSGSLFSSGQTVKAVNQVSFQVRKGETRGLVGESGCGKSTLGRTILRLTSASEGEVYYHGQNLFALSKREMRNMRQKLQMIFQDPYASLNPRMNVEELVRVPLDVFQIGTRASRRDRVVEILEIVGLGEQHLGRFPHEFSGGQRQRLGIARALILQPEFVVCDEPVSALDVSVRAAVLNLMKDLQRQFQLTYLFISHDLSVVNYLCDRVAVMYLGQIVEIAEKEELFRNPLHPYTKALMKAIPVPDIQKRGKTELLEGDVPSPLSLPAGCLFHTRCPYCTEQCRRERPDLREKSYGHCVACHLDVSEAVYEQQRDH